MQERSAEEAALRSIPVGLERASRAAAKSSMTESVSRKTTLWLGRQKCSVGDNHVVQRCTSRQQYAFRGIITKHPAHMQALPSLKRTRSPCSGRASKHKCRAPACAKDCRREEQLLRHESCCPLLFSWRQSGFSSDVLPDERGVCANDFSSVSRVSRKVLCSETACETLLSTHSLDDHALEEQPQLLAASAGSLQELCSTVFATREDEDEDEVAIQRGEDDHDYQEEWEVMEAGCVSVSDVEDEEVEKSKSTQGGGGGGEIREPMVTMDMHYAKRIAGTHYSHHAFAPLLSGMASMELTTNARTNLEKLWYLVQLEELDPQDRVARGRGDAVRVRLYCVRYLLIARQAYAGPLQQNYSPPFAYTVELKYQPNFGDYSYGYRT